MVLLVLANGRYTSAAPNMGSRERGIRWFTGALPSFHAFAFAWQFILPFGSGHYGGHFAPQYPAAPILPNPENALEACRLTQCNAVPAVPSFVEVCERFWLWRRKNQYWIFVVGMVAR
jgi:hypothetical protein